MTHIFKDTVFLLVKAMIGSVIFSLYVEAMLSLSKYMTYSMIA